MRFAAHLAAISSLLAVASARIYGIAVPDQISPTAGFNIRIYSENYIQSVYDVAIVVGGSPVTLPVGSLGLVYDSFYLGPQQSNLGNTFFTKWVQPSDPSIIPQGPVKIEASLSSLYGAGSAPAFTEMNVTTTIGSSTSSNYITSF